MRSRVDEEEELVLDKKQKQKKGILKERLDEETQREGNQDKTVTEINRENWAV